MNFSLYRYLLVALIGLVLTCVLHHPSYSQSLTTLSADELNQEGFSLLYSGAPSKALSTWREAEQLYREEDNAEGVSGTLLNQSLAQKALGLHPLACETTTKALHISKRLCDPQAGSELVVNELLRVELSPVNVIGIRLLGESLGQLSNLEEAIIALTTARELASPISPQQPLITFSLANIYNLSFQSALQDYIRTDQMDAVERSQALAQASEGTNKAISLYETVSNTLDVKQATKAQVNTIGMFAYIQKQDVEHRLSDRSLIEPIAEAAQRAYSALKFYAFDEMPTVDAIYIRLNLADSLLTIKRINTYPDFSNAINYAEINKLIDAATFIVEKGDNYRALSSVYGMTGDLLSQMEGSNAEIANQYDKALSLAQSIRADDIAYQWAYKLARLKEQEGDVTQAEKYYRSAISALTEVRADLLAVSSELRFSFREKVEPVYRDYMRLLAAQEQPKLEIIEQVHDSLQLAQIENYLRCGRLVSASDLEDKERATVHVINLGDLIQVIVRHEGQFYGYSAPAEGLLGTARSLNIITQADNFETIPEEEFVPYSQRLYDTILKPAIEAGVIEDGQEIAFVLDAPLQSLSMGLLHDGQDYLIKTHPIIKSLQMQRMRLAEESSSALFAGLSALAPSFDDAPAISTLGPLPETSNEALYLNAYLNAPTLLNQDFTVTKLGNMLADSRFKVIHISTHGQFSSTPQETFLLAWDKLIDLNEFGQLFRRAAGIDLLFLSACQSAAGDNRATLGLAGLAVQSGARNAIAPLWLQDSTAGSILIQRFYQALATGLTPAESLQQAQVNLMESQPYSHPYYWATFVLAAR